MVNKVEIFAGGSKTVIVLGTGEKNFSAEVKVTAALGKVLLSPLTAGVNG